MRILKLGCAALALIVLVAAGLLVWLSLPYRGHSGEVLVDIERGTNTRQMGAILANAGVIRSEWQFLIARAIRSGVRLQAGEYQFTDPLSVFGVIDKIGRGDVYYHEVKVPEGHNIFEIAGVVAALNLIKREDFMAAARDSTLIRDLAPTAPSLEGYLFPSTYRITRNTTAAQLCKQMTGQFRTVWKELNPREGTDVHAMVTLASLVEKETAVPEERGRIASVYANRLRLGMRLDADPTTIYAALLENRYTGTIRRSDLDSLHRYNTYRNRGLPPGPIANPGKASLEAALRPDETEYLFFVAKPDGSGAHVFSTTLADHNVAVRDLRGGQTK
jgi:UPF0755 protein